MDPNSINSNPIVDWLSVHGVDWGLKLVTAIVIFVVGRWIVGLITRLLSRALTKADVDQTLTGFLVKIAHVFLSLIHI